MPANKKQKPIIAQAIHQGWTIRFLRNLLPLFVLIFALMGARLLLITHAATVSDERIIATLYAYPTESSWQQVEQASPTVHYAIVNICAPDGSGPGCNGSPASAQNPDWLPTITALKSAGITPLYYISTKYGAVSLNTLESELQQSINWYGITSPHWDTMEPSGTCNNGGSPMSCTTYNQDLYNYAIANGASAVMFNPGTTYNVSTADMFGTKEIIEVYEGTATSFESTSFPSWMSSYSPNQFVAVLSAGTTSTIGTDVSDAVKDNIGNIYEDDEAEPPNYATLPSFWNTEVSDVSAYDTSGTSSSSGTSQPSSAPISSTATQSQPAAPKTVTSGSAPSDSSTSSHTVGTTIQSSTRSSYPSLRQGSSASPASPTGTVAQTSRSRNLFMSLLNLLFARYKGPSTISIIGAALVLAALIFAILYIGKRGVISKLLHLLRIAH